MKRTESNDEEELLRFIEEGAHRTGKSVEIPSPEGRTQSGWVAIQALKIQPEVHTMLEQLREHKLFKQKWKTSAQVAWSMIYLGLQSCYQFYSKESVDWDEYKSNFVAHRNSLKEQEDLKSQELLIKTARTFRGVIHNYLDKGSAFGKYKAWRTIEKAIETRDVVEDVKAYDEVMRMPPPPNLGANLVFDNRAGEYWGKLYPVIGGDLDDGAADTVYTSLTTEYFGELEAVNAAQHHEE